LLGVPLIGTAAAAGLILYFVCALFTHLRVYDFVPQFYLAIVFLGLAAATLALDPAVTLTIQ
ncbi:DoxX family protein, partial [Nonomuraea sp. MG754425]|uniref:DoxX family protein n=1 Tax=Nonomuraea sp. MG754425 TaxID=2570319 RepID=UPI001F3BBE79